MLAATTRDDSAVHRLSPRVKVIALIAFALGVVATPREWFAVFALAAGVLVALALTARIRPAWIVRRLIVEVPFVVFAMAMVFVATGPRVQIGALSLSIAGVWGAWAMLVKATLTLVAALILAATTEPQRIVTALGGLGLPRQLTVIMGLMLRYTSLVGDEFERTRVARASRGFQIQGPRAWRILASSIATLFARAHGRGERIHLAMVARGYQEP